VPDNQANYNHLKILIAEDIKTNQILLKALLAKLFSITSVDVAENGKQAVEMALKNQYDLILMDLKMPTMDGLEATRILRQKGVKIPIYMLTADVYNETQVRSQKAGTDGFLKKPVETDKLTEVLDRVARNRSKFAN
jgi:CheY-like chemotaxis protein